MKLSIDQFRHDPTAQQSQPRELERVSRHIEMIVLEFCRQHNGMIIHMPELEAYVNQRRRCTPGSAGRILRKLRKAGSVSYEVINKAKSMYKLNSVRGYAHE